MNLLSLVLMFISTDVIEESEMEEAKLIENEV
jgi:hypothetical protein